MKLYQPVMFVGLGGTGCDIGAELERKLREEICGPDGNAFRRLKSAMGMLPYQLPSCLQFIYADMNQSDLERLPRRVVPGSEHVPAVLQTAHYVRDLVPPVDSYPELARNLRLEAPRVVEGWLPQAQGEPRVNPLHRGAGQFPTIGRAALFGAVLGGISTAVREIHAAIGKLANSGEDLYALSGQPPRGVDVFVAFSVAGGTGGGIFYDYLHLIGEMFRQTQLRVKIYPLVLMPSAFEPGLGGGRAAELNAARALLDLFRLVDQQNSADAERTLASAYNQRPIDPEEAGIHYPQNLRIVLRPGIVQTGFLFSQPAEATREDLHRSIVSLVMSLVGTERSEEGNRSEEGQSFADSFVNEAAHRQVRAGNGIGNRGVSTALVASLTVPVDELADIVSGRLLRTAIEQLSVPIGSVESNRAEMEDFLLKANVHPILRRSSATFTEPEPARGAREVAAALNDRMEAMKAGIASTRVQVGREVPRLASAFDPRKAVWELLDRLDAFRVQRVVFGHPDMEDEVDRGGVAGFLDRRRATPTPPAGYGPVPPPIPDLTDRSRLLKKLGWHDALPLAARHQQDTWYEWAARVAWAEAWAAHAPQWRRPLDQVDRDLSALTTALKEFARQDMEDYGRRSADLYRRRVGVSYLLPSGSGRLEEFYQQVVRRLHDHGAREGRIKPNSSEGDLLRTLVGPDGWRQTYRISVEGQPRQAVSYLREQVKIGVKTFLRQSPSGDRPMLPKLQDLLTEAAGREAATSAMQDYLQEFSGKLAGLLPANFTPQGSGPMKILISYPADAPSEFIEGHLRSAINLPSVPGITYDFGNTHTESISVVLFRTAMGITEVSEVRDVLRLWADAQRRPEPTDLLRWRQRTGYDFAYLATCEEHRVEILHRLLCAFWNGKVTIEGPEQSPDQVSVTLEGGVSLALGLNASGEASSWSTLLRAYELAALEDDDIHRRFCMRLMRELPDGLEGKPQPPSRLYLAVRDLAEGQIECLDGMMRHRTAALRIRAEQQRGFWADTLPAALDLEFSGVEYPIAANLRHLEKVALQESSG
jgi:tubulin-like protein